MKSWIAPISDNCEVTTPLEIRRLLGLDDTNGVLIIARDDGVVELRSPSFTLEEVLGSIDPLPNESSDLDKEIEAAITTMLPRRDTSLS